MKKILMILTGVVWVFLALTPISSTAQTIVSPCVTGTGIPATSSSCSRVTTTNALPVTMASSSAGVQAIVNAIVAGYLTPPFGVTPSPSASAAVGIVPVVSSSLEACHVLKNAAGNAYEINVTNTDSSTDWVLVFDASSAPSPGAVTPIQAVQVGATGLYNFSSNGGPPLHVANGAVACLSSTGPFTYTAVAKAFISGEVQ